MVMVRRKRSRSVRENRQHTHTHTSRIAYPFEFERVAGQLSGLRHLPACEGGGARHSRLAEPVAGDIARGGGVGVAIVALGGLGRCA